MKNELKSESHKIQLFIKQLRKLWKEAPMNLTLMSYKSSSSEFCNSVFGHFIWQIYHSRTVEWMYLTVHRSLIKDKNLNNKRIYTAKRNHKTLWSNYQVFLKFSQFRKCISFSLLHLLNAILFLKGNFQRLHPVYVV